MTLTPTTWTPVFNFSTPGDLSVSYSNQKADYFQDPTTGMTILRYSVTFTPTFTTSGGAAQITGHGLTKVGGAFEAFLGVSVNNAASGYAAAVFMPAGSIQHATAWGSYLGTSNFVSGTSYSFEGSLVLVTVPPA